MIGNSWRKADFSTLARYLERGADARADRVEWWEGRNVAADSIAGAAREMSAEARQNDVVDRPVYHLEVSFPADERVARPLMITVADRTLADLDLSDHQAVIVSHRDKPHQHFHCMVNLVHPWTHLRWDDRMDHFRLQRSLREQERELGLTETPGTLFLLRGQEPPSRARTRGAGERRRQERTGEPSVLQRAREVVPDAVASSLSFAELDARLRDFGFHTRATSRGLVVGNQQGYVPLSHAAHAVSLRVLEERFGQRYADYASQLALAERVAERSFTPLHPGSGPRGGPAGPPAEPASDPAMEAALGLAPHPVPSPDAEPPPHPPPARPTRRPQPRRAPPGQESLPLAPPASSTDVPPGDPAVSPPVKAEGLIGTLNRLRADLAADREHLTRTRAEVDRLLRRAESLKEEWEPQLLSLLQAAEEILARPLDRIHAAARELATAQDQGTAATERLIRDASEEASRRAAATEEALSTAERRLATLAARTDGAIRKWDQWASEMAARADRATHALTWRGRLRQMVPHLAAACLCAVTIVLVMTWTRPAWTLTAEQREALLVGQGVTELYLNSTPGQQAMMRRTNRWREPFSAEPRDEAPRPTR